MAKDKEDEQETKERLSEPIPFILSDESINKRGGVIKTRGIFLEEFLRNPIMFYNHLRRGNYDDNPLPIGKWENVRVVGKKLIADARFHLEDNFAKSIYQKVKAGILNAVSIGLYILKTSTDAKDLVKGQTCATITASMLFECSIVDIPSNGNAMRIDTSIGTFGETAVNNLIDIHYYVPDPKNTGRYVELNLNENPQALEEILPLINNTSMSKDTDAIIKLMGLPEDSTSLQLFGAITKLKNDHDTLEQELEIQKAAMQEQKCQALISEAIEDRRLTEAQRDSWLNLAKGDYEGTKEVLDGMVKAPKITEAINNGAGNSKLNNKKLSDEALFEAKFKAGELDDWKVTNPDEYARCRAAWEDE